LKSRETTDLDASGGENKHLLLHLYG
jgi:hypothetical protein